MVSHSLGRCKSVFQMKSCVQQKENGAIPSSLKETSNTKVVNVTCSTNRVWKQCRGVPPNNSSRIWTPHSLETKRHKIARAVTRRRRNMVTLPKRFPGYDMMFHRRLLEFSCKT